MPIKEFFRPNIFKIIFTIILSSLLLYAIYYIIYSQSYYLGVCDPQKECLNYDEAAKKYVLYSLIPVFVIGYFISCLMYFIYKKIRKQR